MAEVSAAEGPAAGTLASQRFAGLRRLWWDDSDAGAWGWCLAPAELIYRVALALRTRLHASGWPEAARAAVPVVSVGNLVVGGTGKTPVARWVVEQLLSRGARPAVLHGGYGGDEPELHRAWYPEVPVLVGRDRVAAAEKAAAGGATVLVLDDGFQHLRLARDLDLVLVTAEGWCRSPHLLPRGPWREPVSALARAQVVAVTRKVAPPEASQQVAREVRELAPAADVVRLELRAAGWRRALEGSGGQETPRGEVVGVAGVARPDLFLAQARQSGAQVAEMLALPDHYHYDARAAGRIRRASGGRPVVTTAKDAIKLRELLPDVQLWVLEQSVVVESGESQLASRLDALVTPLEARWQP